ncbi:MAG: AccI family restriction endonuclease [Armatimonadetes bacterium]|nr:AccI family restriction endonuclease [Armatimonadota bacterium]
MYDTELTIAAEEIEALKHGHAWIPWSQFVLNPRRLWGSDFLMRWSQGRWSEDRLVQAVNETGTFVALPYGPSGTAPDNDPRAFELYFERLEEAGLGDLKRPDLLIFHSRDRQAVDSLVSALGGVAELPFRPESDTQMQYLIGLAVMAVECENSLWVCEAMPDFGVDLTPQRRLGGRPGLRKSAVVPTIIVKEEDRANLVRWEESSGKPIHVWHAFYDRAYGIACARVEDLITTGLIEPTMQVFQAPSGATSAKTIYKVYYHYAYPLGNASEPPAMEARCIQDRNGHILPYVTFVGGSIELAPDALSVIASLADQDGAASALPRPGGQSEQTPRSSGAGDA